MGNDGTRILVPTPNDNNEMKWTANVNDLVKNKLNKNPNVYIFTQKDCHPLETDKNPDLS